MEYEGYHIPLEQAKKEAALRWNTRIPNYNPTAMKVKYGNKVYDVLFTKTEFGEIWYAIEDEPNHIDFVHNVEIVKS